MFYANSDISAACGLCRYLHVSNQHDTHRLILCTGCTGATNFLCWLHTFMISLQPFNDRDAVIINDVAC